VRVGVGVSAGQQAEATAYAVCAESAVNAWKHSYAEHVTVDVWVDDALLHVTVRDDGVGGADPQGSGLLGLADRVATLRGSFDVVSESGVGTLVSASLLRVTRS
jgi:signal transduction histidine kinase